MKKRRIKTIEALEPQICVKEPTNMPSAAPITPVFVDLSKQVLPDPDYDNGENDMADFDNERWEWGDPDPDYDPDEIDYTDALPEESLFPFSDGDDDDTEPEQVEEEEDCEDPDEEEY